MSEHEEKVTTQVLPDPTLRAPLLHHESRWRVCWSMFIDEACLCQILHSNFRETLIRHIHHRMEGGASLSVKLDDGQMWTWQDRNSIPEVLRVFDVRPPLAPEPIAIKGSLCFS